MYLPLEQYYLMPHPLLRTDLSEGLSFYQSLVSPCCLCNCNPTDDELGQGIQRIVREIPKKKEAKETKLNWFLNNHVTIMSYLI